MFRWTCYSLPIVLALKVLMNAEAVSIMPRGLDLELRGLEAGEISSSDMSLKLLLAELKLLLAEVPAFFHILDIVQPAPEPQEQTRGPDR